MQSDKQVNNKLLINSLKIEKNLFLKQKMAIYSFYNTNDYLIFIRSAFHSSNLTMHVSTCIIEKE
ncbi:hypothetical protein AI19_00325 [Thalassolituus oleivorans 4BN06-13]|nr:hypothetical protein [Thalassolituus oleivorans 4BN06-13]